MLLANAVTTAIVALLNGHVALDPPRNTGTLSSPEKEAHDRDGLMASSTSACSMMASMGSPAARGLSHSIPSTGNVLLVFCAAMNAAAVAAIVALLLVSRGTACCTDVARLFQGMRNNRW